MPEQKRAFAKRTGATAKRARKPDGLRAQTRQDRRHGFTPWLAWRLGVVEARNAQALELYVQLELIRAEVEALRGRDVRNLRHPPSTAFPSPDVIALDPLGKLAAAGEGLEE